MNITKKRLLSTVLILLVSSESFCSENAVTNNWFGGMYATVKRYLNSWQWPKTVGGVPLLYGMRNYNPQQQDVNAVRVPSSVRSAQIKINQQKLPTFKQLTPPRATLLEPYLQAFSAEEKKEKEIVLNADQKLSILESMINSKQKLSTDQLGNLEKSFKEVENSLASLKISRNREYVENVIARKDKIGQAFETARSVAKPQQAPIKPIGNSKARQAKNARKKEQYQKK